MERLWPHVFGSRGMSPSLTAENLMGTQELDRMRSSKAGTIANLTKLYTDGIFHLAWSTLPGSAEQIPGEDIRTNVAGSLELFPALRKCGVRTVFVSSGGTVYGLPNEVALSDGHPLNPIGVYGLGKLATEQYADLLR